MERGARSLRRKERGARSAERSAKGRADDGAGRGRAVFGGREIRRERGEVDGLITDVGQDGAGAGEGAKLGGGQETLGGVLNGVEDGWNAGKAVFEAGVGVEGSLTGVGIVMLGEAAHGGAGHDEDGDKEMKEGGAVAGGGGLDVLSEEFENGH